MTPGPVTCPGYRFPAEIVSHAVWLCHVFSLSPRDVELILAERGLAGTHEGSVATIAVDCEWPRRATDQAALNNSATKAAWTRMSRPPIVWTCPFLIIAITS
jgi:hypothetical protein